MVDAGSRDQNKFLVRMPPGMRERIAGEAEANNRSMNAEIIARLQASLDGRVLSEPSPNLSSDLRAFAAAMIQAADAARKDGKRMVLEFKEVDIEENQDEQSTPSTPTPKRPSRTR